MSKYLFLDRDGVINKRLPGRYVSQISEFEFADEVLEAFPVLSQFFDRIFVVTNQQGIGKGIMTERQLAEVHAFMKVEIEKIGGRIDGIYFCPELADSNPHCRKPNPGMAFQAKRDFPEISFEKSIMVGDSNSDMLFGKRLKMKTVLIESNPKEVKKTSITTVDQRYSSLSGFVNNLSTQ